MIRKRSLLFNSELSAMIQGAENGSNFIVKHYKEEEAKDIFKSYMTSKLGSE